MDGRHLVAWQLEDLARFERPEPECAERRIGLSISSADWDEPLAYLEALDG